MRESISYTFILNIVIVFIFTCFAVVMGLLSYYRAFKANSIISSAIEKYEGYNCISKNEIAEKLATIGYETPFNVECKDSDGNCEVDNIENGNYKVISYNIDFENIEKSNKIELNDKYVYDEKMNSSYVCNGNDCITNKHYQYGIYTYMYVDMPVISQLLRLSFFSKTSIMYEFRNFYVEEYNGNTITTDVESTPIYYQKEKKEEIKDGKSLGYFVHVADYSKIANEKTGGNMNIALEQLNISYERWYEKFGKENNLEKIVGSNYFYATTGTNLRKKVQIANVIPIHDQTKLQLLTTGIPRKECGYVRDYTRY